MLAPVGERAIAAGILTAAAFRNGDPAACTLLPRAIEQLMAQAIGSLSICAATLVVAFALMYAVKLTGTLRISREGEIEGLDLHEHGMLAYPEYVIHGYDPTPHSAGGMQGAASQALAHNQPQRAQ